MKNYYFLGLLLLFGCTVSAQNPIRLVSVGTPAPNEPLILVNGKIIAENHLLKLIAATDIENVEVLKDAASTALYGIRGTSGVIVVTLKKNAKLLTYQKLLKKFKVRREYRQYVPHLDHQPIINIEEFYASPNKIKAIQLAHRNNGISEIPYLNIVTNK